MLDDDSVLVKVRAASINAYDWHMMRGLPFLARMSEGLRKPKSIAMGVDVAGQVEAVGKNVTHLRPGDEVFGARSGALAEYVRGSAKSFLVPKPGGPDVRASRGHAHGGNDRPCRAFATEGSSRRGRRS